MRIPGWLFIVGVIAFIGGTALCSAVSYLTAQRAAVDLGASGMQVASFADYLRAQPTATNTPTAPPPTATPRPGDTPVPTSAAPTATPDPLAEYTWEDPRQINILLLGIDQRRGETGSFNTDTMIVLSISPVRKSVGMLSIPRDLWVQIPGYQPNRINTANRLGDGGGYPGGGAALAARTVTENLGMQVDKYVLINFDVFTTVVDLVAPDGVEVCPTEEIDDPYYPDAGYGFIHVHFDPGCQRLDAEHLLQYARTRHTQNSDFDRAQRQQEVIKAVRDEVLNAGGIANFITHIPELWNELADSYKTNLTMQEILGLAGLAQEIPSENIRSGVINHLHTSPQTNPNGDQVLILNYSAFRGLLQQVFGAQEDLSLSDLRQRAQEEDASIVVYNNTDTAGLASQTRDWLSSRQVTVTSVGNMPTPENQPTIIRDYTGKSYTAQYLAALLGVPADRIQPGTDGLTAEDVMVVVGSDVQQLLGGQ